MARNSNGLSALAVERLKSPGFHRDRDGLYLKIVPSGARVWVLRYQIAGRRRDMGLGSASIVGLAKARERVQELRRLIAEGIDPLEQRDRDAVLAKLETAKAMTFRECAEAYIASMRAGWKNAKHEAQWSATLRTYAYPVLADLPIASIDLTLVLNVIEPIWTTKTETASRVRGRIESIIDYARVRGYRTDGENPARWKGFLDHVLAAKGDVAKVEHHTSMAYPLLPTFWPRLQMHDGLAARALEFCILTATRTTEVLEARWSEVDIDNRIWTIPAERMKAGKVHRVPLSEAAVVLIHKLAAVRVDDYVFPGQSPGRPLSNMAMRMCLRRMKVPATTHGFRATFRTWCAERTAFPHEVAEAALAHVAGDRVVAAYQRGDMLDRRRRLMDEWAAYCTTPRGTGEVVPLRA